MGLLALARSLPQTVVRSVEVQAPLLNYSLELFDLSSRRSPMAIDPYSACPCGSGKKLKFCCSDLAADIEKVQKMVAGDQPHAAQKHVEQLLVKQPKRASLLDLLASLQLSLHEFEAARNTIGDFLESHPLSPTANAQAAILLAAMENGRKAVGPLQNALEQLDQEMPLRVLEAVGAVGQSLLMQGELIAARAHLLLYAAISPEEDNRGVELLLRMNLQAGLPLLLRESWQLVACPDEVEWQGKFEKAAKFSMQGLWRQSEALFAELREEVGPVPEVVYNLALLRGWLGDVTRFAAGLHEYAQLEVPLDNAVEAEALAQLIDPTLEDPKFDTFKSTYELSDVEAMSERFANDKRLEDYTIDPQEFGDDELARPRSTHVLLDRPTPETGVDIERGDIPHVMAFLSIYGKRTDREARIEVTTDRGDDFERTEKLLAEVTGNELGEPTEEAVVAQKSISEESLSWRWRLPNDTPAEHRQKLLAEERREAILVRWSQAPRASLQNKSPQEAVGNEELRIPLLASALIIEQAAVDPAELPMFAELRQQLELPALDKVDPIEIDLDHVPLVRVPRFDLAKLDDERLAKLLDRTVLMGAKFATLLAAKELVARPELSDKVDLTAAFRQLIRLEPNPTQALDWAAQARKWSEQKSRPTGEWALMELELSIERGDADGVRETLAEIRTTHLNEPGIAEATYRLLYASGLVAPPDASGRPAPDPLQPTPGDTEAAGIWTPDSDAPVAAGGEEKSVIWTP